jgi:spore maturation protein CgeB
MRSHFAILLLIACGAALVAERLPLEASENPLVDGTHFATYAPDCRDLAATISALLTDEPRRASIAAAGQAHVFAHHSGTARARQLLRLVGVSL